MKKIMIKIMNYYFRLSERTYSLWGYLANNTNEYISPIYRCNRYNNEDSADVLQPKLAPQSIM